MADAMFVPKSRGGRHGSAGWELPGLGREAVDSRGGQICLFSGAICGLSREAGFQHFTFVRKLCHRA